MKNHALQNRSSAKQKNREKSKSLPVAYILWFAFGLFGAHRFYLCRTRSAIAMLMLSLTGFGLAATLIWWIADAFLLPQMMREEQARRQRLRSYMREKQKKNKARQT